MSPTQPSLIETSLTDEWVSKKFENKNATIRIGTLFSGIGAIEHALQRLKLKTEISLITNETCVYNNYFFDLPKLDIPNYLESIKNTTDTLYDAFLESRQSTDAPMSARFLCDPSMM